MAAAAHSSGAQCRYPRESGEVGIAESGSLPRFASTAQLYAMQQLSWLPVPRAHDRWGADMMSCCKASTGHRPICKAAPGTSTWHPTSMSSSSLASPPSGCRHPVIPSVRRVSLPYLPHPYKQHASSSIARTNLLFCGIDINLDTPCCRLHATEARKPGLQIRICSRFKKSGSGATRCRHHGSDRLCAEPPLRRQTGSHPASPAIESCIFC